MCYIDDERSHCLGYTKQPEDGLKWAETCSCGIYVHFVHKLLCVLTANYTLYLFMEHNGDVTINLLAPEFGI